MRLWNSNEFPAGMARSETRKRMEEVSEHDLRSWVQRIAIPRNIHAQPASNQEVANWIGSQFSEWGYSVQTQGPFNNVLALPRKLSRTLLLVGAHYDSVPQTPGADDNASAVAAMLGCAKILARFAPDAPVCFAAFNAEENGLGGSKDFVTNFLSSSAFRISQAEILEMVGFASAEIGSQKTPTGLPIAIPDPGDFLGLLANEASATDFQSILKQARTYLPDFKVMGLQVAVGAERVLPVLGRSDHVPFWQNGIPAVMWTDTSEFRNPHYHQPTDLPETLDYSFLQKVTQLLVATVSESVAQ